jgi:hypothetical protein
VAAHHQEEHEPYPESECHHGRVRRGLKGSWGAMDEAQTGIVHVPRYTMHGAMSYLSRIASQMTEVARSQRTTHPRYPLGSSVQ